MKLSIFELHKRNIPQTKEQELLRPEIKILVFGLKKENRSYFYKTFQLLYSHGQVYLS